MPDLREFALSFANSTASSEADVPHGFRPLLLVLDGDVSTATVSFEAFAAGGWRPLHDRGGSALTVTVAPNRAVTLADLGPLPGLRLRLRSDVVQSCTATLHGCCM